MLLLCRDTAAAMFAENHRRSRDTEREKTARLPFFSRKSQRSKPDLLRKPCSLLSRSQATTCTSAGWPSKHIVTSCSRTSYSISRSPYSISPLSCFPPPLMIFGSR
jgi:hypothetical protein